MGKVRENIRYSTFISCEGGFKKARKYLHPAQHRCTLHGGGAERIFCFCFFYLFLHPEHRGPELVAELVARGPVRGRNLVVLQDLEELLVRELLDVLLAP